MRHILLRPLLLTFLWLLGVAAVAAPQNELPIKTKPIPPFTEVEKSVQEYFKAIKGFQENDLLTRKMVEPLLKQLQRSGFPLNDADQILAKVPADDEFLAVQLSTAHGRQFMRRISKYPDGYDRIDRLSRMPHGQQTIRDLIRGPGGEKMIEYMTTTQGGTELGNQLSNSPTGKQFNEPTGRIYTMSLLLARLQQSHAAAMKAARKKSLP